MFSPNDPVPYSAVSVVRSGFLVCIYTVAAEAYSVADCRRSFLLALYSDTDSILESEYLPRSTCPFCALVMRMPSRYTPTCCEPSERTFTVFSPPSPPKSFICTPEKYFSASATEVVERFCSVGPEMVWLGVR